MEPTEDQILPPRLEDAGLEDCALPLDSIMAAFQIAAAAAAEIVEEDEDSAGDPWPEDSHGDSVAVAGTVESAGESDGGDVAASGGEDEKSEKCCIDDGLKGLEIKDEDERSVQRRSEKTYIPL